MKYFFDTEFIEWAGGIDLVSIGIVCEDGRTLYAESINFDERNASDWVWKNVLVNLKYWTANGGSKGTFANPLTLNWEIFGSNHLIGMMVKDFLRYDSTLEWWKNKTKPIGPYLDDNGTLRANVQEVDENIEFYAYYADYDWVIFCRLFGRMIDLPEGFPMWCIDLKQMMWERGLDKNWKQSVCPDPEGEHNALVDAEWNKKLFHEIIKKKHN